MSTAMATMPAFAAADKTITINNATEGATFTAYQIFKGKVVQVDGQDTLSVTDWGTGINSVNFLKALKDDTEDAFGGAFTAATTPQQVADILAANSTDSSFVKAFGKLAESYTNGTGTAGNYEDGTYTISNVEDGYYIVVESGSKGEATIPILQIAGASVDYLIKVDVPTSDKIILDADEGDVDAKGKTAVAGVGSKITYQLTATLPGNYAEYEENGYALYFIDELPPELTLVDGSIKAWVNEVTENATEDATEVSKEVHGYEPYYVVTSDNKLYVYFLDLYEWNPDLTYEDTIILTYETIVNENATAGTEIKNKAYTRYPKNPDVGGWPKGPDGKEPGDEEYPWEEDLPGNPDPENPNDPNNPEQPDNPPPPPYDPDDPDGPSDPPDYPDYPGPDDPDDPSKPEYPMDKTPEAQTSTWVFETDINKTGKDENDKLTGAGFTITNADSKTAVFAKTADGEYKFVAWVTDASGDLVTAIGADTLADIFGEDAEYGDEAGKVKLVTQVETAAGKLVLDGLAPGTYKFSETQGVDGYKTVADFDVTLEANKTNDAYDGKLASTTAVNAGDSNVTKGNLNTPKVGAAYINVVDPPEGILPSTGGAGVYFYYIAGGALVILAIGGLASSKKKKENA